MIITEKYVILVEILILCAYTRLRKLSDQIRFNSHPTLARLIDAFSFPDIREGIE